MLSSEDRLEAELGDAKEKGYDLVYIYSGCKIQQDGGGEFLLVDVGGQIEYIKTLTGVPDHCKHNPSIIEYTDNRITPDIMELAYLSGHRSRFRVDSYLPTGSFEKLYETWIAKTIAQAPSARIYAFYREKRAVGMITAERYNDSCTIGLLAVHPSCRGLGIATKLIRQVESFCLANNICTLEVKTQLSNVMAQSLYLKNSFLEAHRTFIYHAHLLAGPESNSANSRASGLPM